MAGTRATLFALLAAAVLAGCGGDGPTEPDEPGPVVNRPPVPRFSVDVSKGPAPLGVTFDARASSDPDGQIVDYRWDFGDGQIGAGEVVTHGYETAGHFVAILEVTDDRGARATAVGPAVTVTAAPGDGAGTIQGVVWHDRDGDGRRSAGDPGIAGAVVFLDENGNAVLDPGELFTVTDAEGRYAFEGVDTSRSHAVAQRLGLGWSNTFAGPESPAGSPSSGAPVSPMVIGGVEAADGELPFMVALLRAADGAFFCGGTFIAAGWVLTAAHCVDEISPVGRNPDNVLVLAGTRNRDAGGERIPVRGIRIFPAFGAHSFVGNDVAVIELDGAFTYPRIELQTRARPGASLPGTVATAAGWGRTTTTGTTSTVLRKVELPLISNDECAVMLDESVVASTICAGELGVPKSVCSGDSGGPLAVRDGPLWVQVGVTSFGAFTCQPPMAFARVSELVDWIERQVPLEPSGAVTVNWSGGPTGRAEFGNFK